MRQKHQKEEFVIYLFIYKRRANESRTTCLDVKLPALHLNPNAGSLHILATKISWLNLLSTSELNSVPV